MTRHLQTTTPPTVATPPAVALLCSVLLDLDDPFGTLLDLRPALDPDAWIAACIAMEVCEDHLCDEAICRDDERTCPSGSRTR